MVPDAPLWLIPLTALVAGALTLFSGFGLNTLLLPVLLLFYPPQVAVLLTACVHLLNNVFKSALVGAHIRWAVVLRFGLPAVGAAYLGAYTLGALARTDTLAYRMAWPGGHVAEVSWLTVVFATLVALFAVWDLAPALSKLSVPARYLPLGGLLSGFFGGLTGHQGALRSAFLLRLGLPPLAYVASGIAIALGIDLVRIGHYLYAQGTGAFSALPLGWTVTTVLAAFTGSYLGSRLVRKTTVKHLQRLVGGLLIALSLAMLLGLVR